MSDQEDDPEIPSLLNVVSDHDPHEPVEAPQISTKIAVDKEGRVHMFVEAPDVDTVVHLWFNRENSIRVGEALIRAARIALELSPATDVPGGVEGLQG